MQPDGGRATLAATAARGEAAMAIDGTDVVVVGGAIAGLTTALLLAEAGASVTLLERVARPQAVGAGILLQPNGLAVLGGLSLGADLERLGHRMAAGTVRDAAGRALVRITLPDGDGFGHVLAVRRSRLFEVLMRAADDHPGIVVRLAADVVAARPDGTVELDWHDRLSTIEAELVVGADGVGSTVRAGGDFGAAVHSTGTAYVRGLAPRLGNGIEGEYWTSLGLFGGAPLGDGSTYFYAAVCAPLVAAAMARRDLAAFRAAWAEVLPPAAAVLDTLTSFEELLVNEVVRVDCERWSDGRLVLVGDAAHAMAPTLGQGANSALVDAAVLVAGLAADQSLEGALAGYAARRRPAVRRVQDAADRMARLSALASPRLRSVRDASMRLLDRAAWVGARQVRLAQQETPTWLYSTVRALRAP
jgi:2-polyprenyl-6-methoxyphenol hydroxylase-like FAD-dependent oxidoreductase